MKVETHSVISNETESLQKLGFDNTDDIDRSLASVMNRLRVTYTPLVILTTFIQFYQIIAISFAPTIQGILSGSSYIGFFNTIFMYFLCPAYNNSDELMAHTYILIIILVLIVIWFVLYFIFVSQYNKNKTFSNFVVLAMYYLGDHVFTFIHVTASTTIGYFLRPLLVTEISVPTYLTFLDIVAAYGMIYVQYYTYKLTSSSPDVDVKNIMSFWPQDIVPGTYRLVVCYIMSAQIELFRNQKSLPVVVPYAINLILGIIGCVTVWYKDSNVFIKGRNILSTEYNIIMASSIASIVYYYLKGESTIYLGIVFVVVVGLHIVLGIYVNKVNKSIIDLLYMRFDDLIEEIYTAQQCIDLIKIGIIFNAPCVTNHTLLNWANTRWPTNQKLVLMVAYIYYIIRIPYREILDLVSVAVDIEPFSNHDSLLFSQIFNRLPTREVQLMHRIEGVKRLYDIPKVSLRTFWESIIQHQWDEAVTRSNNFCQDIERINQIFSNLIFDNPSSDAVMVEFIKFASEIMGNYALANAAQRELARRQVDQEDDQVPGDGESQQQLSKLSSVKSSVFLSEFSEVGNGADRVNNGIQSAFTARPTYWPFLFFVTTVISALLSFAMIIIVYSVAMQETARLENQIMLSMDLHEMGHRLAQMLCNSLVFSTHDKDTDSVIGYKINVTVLRSLVNELSNDFDSLLSDSFTYHSYMPTEFLKQWVDTMIDTDLLAPTEKTGNQFISVEENISLITAVRLFQMRAITLAFTPDSGLGSIASPNPELLQVTYLYPAVAEVTRVLLSAITAQLNSEQSTTTKTVLMVTVILVCVLFVLMCISIPVVIVGYMKEFDFFVSLFQSIPPKTAYRILGTSAEAQTVHESDTSKKIMRSHYHICEMVTIFLVIMLIMPLPVLFVVLSYMNHIDTFSFIARGLELSSTLVSNFGLMSMHSFRFVSGFTSTLTKDQEKEALNESATAATNVYRELFFGGTDRFPTGLLYTDPEMLAELSTTKCNVLLGAGQLNNTCMAFHDTVFFIFDLVKRLISISNPPTAFDDPWWRSFFPAARVAMNEGIPEYFTIFEKMRDNAYQQNNSMMTTAIVIAVVLFFIAVIGCYYYQEKVLNTRLKNLTKPLTVMSPEFIAECPFLMRYLQGDFDHHDHQATRDKNRKTGDNQTPMIDFILEGILVMTADGTIIASNKKYHEMMANTADEVLGQNVRNVLPLSSSIIYDALDAIRQGGLPQQNVTLETTLFTEDDRELQVRISLVAQLGQNEHGNRSTMCAMIIYDRSDLIKAQERLRKEKANVEQLLDSILPHNIAVSLLNGQTEISFQAERACVLFSDLVSFTPMCSTMSAKQIMTTLNLLFTEFDNELTKYPRVTKLKTIGDAYVCAAGIFEGDGPIEDAACEIVQFAIRMQEIVPMLNRKHNLKLHQRVGVHCGGPLICGVLGKEKPLFEVIGTTVTLAEELEATAVHDKVHIHQSLADLVGRLNLKLVDRGGGIKIHGIDEPTYTIE